MLSGLAVLVAISGFARSYSLTEILRNTALHNGLRPAAQLFDDTDAALAAVGKQFFESKNVSLNGRMACRTCHLDQFGSADGLPNAIGIFGEGEGTSAPSAKAASFPEIPCLCGVVEPSVSILSFGTAKSIFPAGKKSVSSELPRHRRTHW